MLCYIMLNWYIYIFIYLYIHTNVLVNQKIYNCVHIERIYITQDKCILYVLHELIVYITTDNKIKNWDNKGE